MSELTLREAAEYMVKKIDEWVDQGRIQSLDAREEVGVMIAARELRTALASGANPVRTRCPRDLVEEFAKGNILANATGAERLALDWLAMRDALDGGAKVGELARCDAALRERIADEKRVAEEHGPESRAAGMCLHAVESLHSVLVVLHRGSLKAVRGEA